MPLYYEWGSTTEALSDDDMKNAFKEVLKTFGEK